MGAGHGHAHVHATGSELPPAGRRVRRLLALALIPLAVATLVGLIVLWPGERPELAEDLGVAAQLVDGEVVESNELPCAGEAEGGVLCLLLTVRLDSGPDAGDEIVLDQSTDRRGRDRFAEGAQLVLGYEPDAPPGSEYFYADHQRDRPLLLLGVAFAVVVVLLGRWKGVAALGGLVVSLSVLVWFVLPAILSGSSPLAVAVVGAAVVMGVALYLAHGVSVRTSVALLGTLVSLALTGVLAAVFLKAADFSGLAGDEATFLSSVAGQVDLRGLLLAGVIIGSLGVLDDVTVTQASAVWELHHAAPHLSARELYSAGLRIGRDHIASTVNTLVLAYAGAALPLLVLFTLAQRGLGDVLTGEIIAQEVVRTLVGSIGLVASVPVTTALAAFVVRADDDQEEAVPEPAAG
jgi:uncharacterized membrane protein